MASWRRIKVLGSDGVIYRIDDGLPDSDHGSPFLAHGYYTYKGLECPTKIDEIIEKLLTRSSPEG
jgi:hypothetical protein